MVWRRPTASIALFGAYLLFMWMFFATEAFKADLWNAYESGVLTVDQLEHGLRLGSAWRHGMVGDWPVFMPGFFVLSFALVWWSAQRSVRRGWPEVLGLLLTASICGAALTHYGQALLSALLERDIGIALNGAAPGWDRLGVATGLLTACAWTLCVLLGLSAIELKQPQIMLLALIPYAVLYVARPGAADELNDEWARRIVLGEPAALLTLALIPTAILGVFWIVRRRCSRRGASDRASAHARRPALMRAREEK